jgi:hypothetical protein
VVAAQAHGAAGVDAQAGAAQSVEQVASVIDRFTDTAVPNGVGRPSGPKSKVAVAAVTVPGIVRVRSTTGVAGTVMSSTCTVPRWSTRAPWCCA